MDLVTVIRFYIDKMLKQVKGMKVLVLDAETTKIVSLVYSQTEILQHEVFLVERLDSEKPEQLLHLKVGASTTILMPRAFEKSTAQATPAHRGLARVKKC